MAAVHREYDLQPGRQQLQFPTGARPPLDEVRFICGGQQDIHVTKIEGAPNGPIITFPPDAPLHAVNIAFGQNPVHSDSADFIIDLHNPGSAANVQITCIFRQ